MLRVGKFLVSTEVNGPGRRFVIWLQGCPFRCPGCFNPEFWDEDGGRFINTEELMTHISSAKDIEGVTFTGGEPLIQAKELLPLAESIKSERLSILCYTGYLLSDILSGDPPYAKDLLKWIDILIDGRYIEEEKAPLLWRGSRNQKVYFLTDRHKDLEPLVSKEDTREVELSIGEEGLAMTGIFDIELWKRLKNRISRK